MARAPAMRSCSAPPSGRDVSLRFDDNLHDLSLQGPTAVDYLAKHVPGIRDLNYFHHMQTQLFGFPVMISRTGYTGERGYEIFCRGQDAGTIWDTILDEGKAQGIIPVPLHHARHAARRKLPAVLPLRQFADVSVRRTKAPATRCGSSASTSPSAPARPASAAPRSITASRARSASRSIGVLLDGKEPADEGAPVYRDGKKVGVVTCAMYSPLVKKSMGIARLDVDCAVKDTKLEIRNKSGADQGDGAAAALRRSEEDQAHREGLRHNQQRGVLGTKIKNGSQEHHQPARLRNPVSAARQASSFRGRCGRRAGDRDLADEAPPRFLRRRRNRLHSRPADGKHVAALEALKPAQFHQAPSFASLLPRLKQTLATRIWACASISPAPKA